MQAKWSCDTALGQYNQSRVSYIVCTTLMDNDIHHHSGQNLFWTHSAASHESGFSLLRERWQLNHVSCLNVLPLEWIEWSQLIFSIQLNNIVHSWRTPIWPAIICSNWYTSGSAVSCFLHKNLIAILYSQSHIWEVQVPPFDFHFFHIHLYNN